VRLFRTAVDRTFDAGRADNVDPVAGQGICSDLLHAVRFAFAVTPEHDYSNGDTPRADLLYLAITNRSGSTGPVTWTATVLPLE
jgi:hypothetical protein